MWRWSVFCCRQRGLTSQVLKVVFAGRGCCCGSIEGWRDEPRFVVDTDPNRPLPDEP